MNLRPIPWFLVLNHLIRHKRKVAQHPLYAPETRGTRARPVTAALYTAGVVPQQRPLPTHVLPIHTGEA